MNKDELRNYYMEKYEGKEWILKSILEKTDEELQAIYEIEKTREENEKEILENGAVTHTISFDYELRKEVEKYMWDHGMFTMYDGDINYRCGSDGVLVGVPIQFIKELQKQFDLKLSREMYILGRKDINNFKVGDKVKIVTSGTFWDIEDQGTVHSINDDEIVVRKYRSRTKGYAFNVGDECKLEKINKFQKVA